MSSSHPVTPIGSYVAVFVCLLIFTALTTFVAFHDLGSMNTPVAIAIAVTKGSMVVLIFMGLRFNTPLTKVVAVAGFFWLLIMFSLTMTDYLSRTWLGVPGR